MNVRCGTVEFWVQSSNLFIDVVGCRALDSRRLVAGDRQIPKAAAFVSMPVYLRIRKKSAITSITAMVVSLIGALLLRSSQLHLPGVSCTWSF
ncbi:hypothetical protein SISNIDRAFT_284275 [Sistotremastrum niveocremeum HHB9708]|uniref:Uncharacterized protein n=1 Tax=Sistotremastrum niveocremeum HHB9708 TaxID=1314777 RepID=A0A164Y961_9AGAM|nr:hypothetical protein SISNIDRAFT_284275 [Sistotremastrum niveocremeum HHB9708]